MLEKIYSVLKCNKIDKEKLIELIPLLKDVDEFSFYHPAHIYSILDHSIKAAETIDDEFLKLVLIFHDVGKIKTSKLVKNRSGNGYINKFDNHELQSILMAKNSLNKLLNKEELNLFTELIRYHDTKLIEENDKSVMIDLIERYGFDFVEKLLKIQRADMITHKKEYYLEKIKSKLDYTWKEFQLYKTKINN